MATSFVCEHSVEYYLVPEFKALLEEEYESVIPLFPWLTREGGKLSREIHKLPFFNVVAMYSRRPKFEKPGSDIVIVKINNELMRAAEQGKMLGIPIIAGIPFARDFFELSKHPKCYWIKLTDYSIADYHLEINKSMDYIPKCGFDNDGELINYIKGIMRPKSFSEILTDVRKVMSARKEDSHFKRFLFASGYRPVYFLIPEF